MPYPLFGLFIGAWVDRVNRKGLMIGLDICRAVLLAVLPLLALLGHLPIWWIYLVTFINSTLTIGFQSATNAAIPSMVAQDGLVKANGRIQASAPFATIIGPFLAALLLSVTSLQAVLWCDALTFVVSAISLALVKTSFNAVAPQAYQAMGSYARVVPTVVFQGTADPVVAPINGDLVVEQWMQTDHLASHERYDASFANPSHIITASPPASHPSIERSWNDSAGHEVQEYWVAVGASHAWTGGSPGGTFTDPLGPNLSQILYRFFLNHPMSLFSAPFSRIFPRFSLRASIRL